jgi:hypothetical protein
MPRSQSCGVFGLCIIQVLSCFVFKGVGAAGILISKPSTPNRSSRSERRGSSSLSPQPQIDRVGRSGGDHISISRLLSLEGWASFHREQQPLRDAGETLTIQARHWRESSRRCGVPCCLSQCVYTHVMLVTRTQIRSQNEL